MKMYSLTSTLAFFLGLTGAHRFYTGYKYYGQLFLFSLLLVIFLHFVLGSHNFIPNFLYRVVWIFWMYDFITICLGKYKDANGNKLEGYNRISGIINLIIMSIFQLLGLFLDFFG